MSYCYDTISRVWSDKIRPLVAEKDEMLALMFEGVLEEMHDANHRLQDAVNKDARVTRAARELAEYVYKKEDAT